MTPPNNIHKKLIPQKIFNFLNPPPPKKKKKKIKKIDIQNFDPSSLVERRT